MNDRPPAPDSKAQAPVSARIRARLLKAKRRFHANDNIAEFLEPGELEALI
ncbi:MAG: GTP cyclohydrolase I, partial [Aquincola sp.]|nr:GTP cyclohydrolase I [Aquincola sp.]